MKPGDRLLCIFVRPQPLHARFTSWSLHITLVPWFRVAKFATELSTALSHIVSRCAPFEVAGTDSAYFGAKKNRLVRLLAVSPSLMGIEQDVRSYLHRQQSWIIDEVPGAHRDFQPHVTEQDKEGLNSNETVWVNELNIVEQQATHKEVVGSIPLGKAAT
ncbi:MAG TPA: 2'-5' RNA ligase family protein [Candidatus Saccharimonadales bacterium]|nr:2'-5' RNA ligase family protein [Candidatus Saccharimonadales bacterium]